MERRQGFVEGTEHCAIERPLPLGHCLGERRSTGVRARRPAWLDAIAVPDKEADLRIAGRARRIPNDKGLLMQPCLQLATTVRLFPETVDMTVVFTAAGAGGTLGSVYGLMMGYSSARIGTASARSTAAGFLLGLFGFALAVVVLPHSDADPPPVIAVIGFLALSRRGTAWLIPGLIITAAGILLVDAGSDAWVAYALTIAGTVVTSLAWELTEPHDGHGGDFARRRSLL